VIFEDFAKWFVEKFLNPCKKCLVQASCNPMRQNKRCDAYTIYLKRRQEYTATGGDVDVYTFLGVAVVGTLFVIATFCLGVWKWVELIF